MDFCFILLSLNGCNVKNEDEYFRLLFVISSSSGKKRNNVFASIVF